MKSACMSIRCTYIYPNKINSTLNLFCTLNITISMVVAYQAVQDTRLYGILYGVRTMWFVQVDIYRFDRNADDAVNSIPFYCCVWGWALLAMLCSSSEIFWNASSSIRSDDSNKYASPVRTTKPKESHELRHPGLFSALWGRIYQLIQVGFWKVCLVLKSCVPCSFLQSLTWTKVETLRMKSTDFWDKWSCIRYSYLQRQTESKEWRGAKEGEQGEGWKRQSVKWTVL